MFPQFKKINNESGIVLFIVLMAVIVIMILSAGILTQSMNENNYAQQQTDQFSCDQLAKGVFWNAYSGGMTIANGTTITENISGRLYEVNVTYGSAVNGITPYNVTCNYDTFQ